MKTLIAVLALLTAAGCASTLHFFVFHKAAYEIVAAATGPCAADLKKAAATCKQQYPELPW